MSDRVIPTIVHMGPIVVPPGESAILETEQVQVVFGVRRVVFLGDGPSPGLLVCSVVTNALEPGEVREVRDEVRFRYAIEEPVSRRRRADRADPVEELVTSGGMPAEALHDAPVSFRALVAGGILRMVVRNQGADPIRVLVRLVGIRVE